MYFIKSTKSETNSSKPGSVKKHKGSPNKEAEDKDTKSIPA